MVFYVSSRNIPLWAGTGSPIPPPLMGVQSSRMTCLGLVGVNRPHCGRPTSARVSHSRSGFILPREDHLWVWR